MRKFLIFAVLVFTFAGCGDRTNNDENVGVTEAKIIVTQDAMSLEASNPFAGYDMDGNKKIVLNDDNDTAKQIAALSLRRNNYAKISKELLSKRLSRNYFLKCSSCHDDYANGVIGPSLLTKNSNEIFDMIKAYKNDEKKNVLMRYLVSQMDDKEIRSFADEIAAFNAEVRGQNESK
jgi:cytochrome c553